MDSFTLTALLVVVGTSVLFGLIVAVILLASRRRPEQPVWRPVGGAAASGSGVWNAEILGSRAIGALGGTLTASFGLMRIDSGMLSFTPDDAAVPTWSVPCQAVGVRSRNLFSLDGAAVGLTGPMGDLRCNVSTERINRLSRNNIKDLRQRRYATEFIAVLRAHGARMVG